MKSKEIRRPWAITVITLTFAVASIASAQDLENSCEGTVFHNECDSGCPPTVTLLNPQITRIYDVNGNRFVDLSVDIGGDGFTYDRFQVTLQTGWDCWSGFINRGSCSDFGYGCLSCSSTIDIDSLYVPSGCGEIILKANALSRWGDAIRCDCSTMVSIPINDSVTGTEEASPPCASLIADPIDARSGNVYYEQRDVSIGSWSGLPIVLTRSYNSTAEIDPNSVFGPKWTYNFNYRIQDAGNGYVEFTTGAGQVLLLKDGYYPLGLGENYQVTFDEGSSRYTVFDYSTGRRYAFNSDGTLDTLYDRVYARLFFSYDDGRLSQVTDASGRYLTFHYNANGKLETIKKMNSQSVATYEYDSALGDTLKKVTYSNGDWESYHYTSVYTAHGLLDIVKTSDGTELNFDYDAMGRGRFAAVNDTLNVENIQYYMDVHHDYIHPDTTFYVTTAEGSDIVTYESIFTSDSTRRVHTRIDNQSCDCGNLFGYNDDFQTTAITYANGRKDSLAYGSYGKIDTLWRDYGGTNERMSSFTYGGAYHQLLTSSLPSLYGTGTSEIEFIRNDAGNATKMKTTGAIDQSEYYEDSISFGYGDLGELEFHDGPRDSIDDTTWYDYYTNGDLQYIHRPNGETFEFGQLDNIGNLTWMESPNGDITRYVFDDYGRMDAIILRAGQYDSLTTSFERNYAGNITKVTYPKGNYMEYIYDDNLLLTDIQAQNGEKIHYEYDPYSRPILEAIVDATDDTVKFERYHHNPQGRLDSITYPDGSFALFTYDDMGNLDTAIDANGNTVTYSYDNLNRLKTFSKLNGGESYTTTFEYDANGNPVNVTDPDGNEFTYRYSDKGQLVYESSGISGVTHYGYDPAGNLVAVKNAADDSIAFTYDEINRLTRIAYPDSQNIDYEYDGTEYAYGQGRLYKETTPACTTTFQYDQFGRLYKEYRATAGDPTTRTTTYSYDDNHNIRWILYPSGFRYHYYYDDLDRVTMIKWTKSGGNYVYDTLVYDIKYDPFGEAVEWKFGNGIVVSQSHNLRYLTDTISTGASGVMSRNYEFDSVGNVTLIVDSLDSQNDVTLTYDSVYQLRTATSSSYPDSVRKYYYSKNGDRDSLVVNVDGAQRTIVYQYTDGKLTQIEDTVTTYLSYDELGNVTKIRTGNDSTTYEYNDAGQLVSVNGGATAQYFYDGRGRRIKVLIGSSGRYIYYDKFGRIMSEYRTAFNKWDRDFIYLNGKIIAELEQHYDQNIESAGMEFGSTSIPPIPPDTALPLPGLIDIFYFHTDYLGTPIAMTDEQTNVAWTARYYPFGEVYYEWATATNNIRFPGQWQDDETDLYYNWHRYYDPATGRYLQPDPLGIPAAGNFYSYARNNPLRFIDPRGLWVAHFNPSDNSVTVTAEEGDDLASLYDAMGITAADQLATKSMKRINETTYDISDLVLLRRDFDPAGSMSKNCYSFVSYTGGVGDSERRLPGLNTKDKSSVMSPRVGDWAVFEEYGNYIIEGDKWARSIPRGTQGHSAIFILYNKAGQAQFLNRINTGEPVTVNSEGEIRAFFADKQKVNETLRALGRDTFILLPKLYPEPKYYRKINR